jgi:protocatechuate 3,4-dioxygenase beta subunit
MKKRFRTALHLSSGNSLRCKKSNSLSVLAQLATQIIFMKPVILIAAMILLMEMTGCSQNNKRNNPQTKSVSHRVGGGCEGCEAVYESPLPFAKLDPTDTMPDFNEQGPKIEISGVVYQPDGKTPAANVVIYVYHTDQGGHYTNKRNETGWGKRHGYIRGWLKTGKNGVYRFYTLKPASYPNSNIPRHIHVTLKEPDKNEYYIDEYLFDDDPFLTTTERNKQEKRGGDGIIKLEHKPDGLLHGRRNIVLGKNIPDYPSH